MVGLAHACLSGTVPSEGEVVWLAVAEVVRGRGIGRALMLAAMNALRQAGAETISLSTDNFAGQVNLALFTSLGFTVRQAVVDFRRGI
jgi:ribosomal protein S18 acetylase RimI-like enzyme